MAVSVVQAANNAFVTWLAARLVDKGYTGPTAVATRARWVTTDKQLPERAITLVKAGQRVDEIHEPYLEGVTAVDASTFDVSYVTATVEQPVQLDVWGRTDVARDDLLAALDGILYAPPTDPGRSGVLVTLGDSITGKADFLFDGPEAYDSPESARRGEWRATVRGRAVMLLKSVARTRRMATIHLRLRLRTQDPPSGLYDVTTFTAAGRTHSTST